MATYSKPKVDVTVNSNPRLINLGSDTRLVALVGLGPMTGSVIDEAVERKNGFVDKLSVYPTTGFAAGRITKITSRPGVATSDIDYKSRLVVASDGTLTTGGALYTIGSASIGADGTLAWKNITAVDPAVAVTSITELNVPATGSVYYVTYTYNLSSTFDPTVYTDKQEIINRFGSENTASGSLTIAGALVLENGAPGVMIVQASGSAYTEAIYRTAIDKLQKKKNIEYVVCVFPSASVTRAQQENTLTYAFNHVTSMSEAGRERGLITGSPSTSFATDGLDTIGDNTTVGTYVYRANALKNKNVIYVVPSRAQRKDADGNVMELDGNFLAAAVGGVFTAQSKISTPINGFQVVGATITDEKWNEAQMDILGAGNCTVLESRGGTITIRDALTTDNTSVVTTEPTVVSQERLVKRTLRDGLKNVYTNQGKVIDAYTTFDVEATAEALLQSLVLAREIYGYGKQDNPATGETKIAAKVDPTDPRKINVTCSVRYLFPLKFLSVSVNVFV